MDFVDTPSSISSQLSLGYSEQGRMFIDDDGYQRSSDSEEIDLQFNDDSDSSPIRAMDEEVAQPSLAPRAALDDDFLLVVEDADEQVMPFE